MQVPNGCIGTNGYINNNNCLLNGTELSGGVVGGAGCNMSSNMSSYTNGQHVVGPFKTYTPNRTEVDFPTQRHSSHSGNIPNAARHNTIVIATSPPFVVGHLRGRK
uniref:Uncharacterized protein n=1 Tax=Anopheles melas TaxID=34690 RepID=A0A182U1S6_9DIPT